MTPEVAPGPCAVDRLRPTARRLYLLAWPERLALLDDLATHGPRSLAVCSHSAGVGCSSAVRHATALEKLGLVGITRTTGLNLSAGCEITTSGLRVRALLDMWPE